MISVHLRSRHFVGRKKKKKKKNGYERQRKRETKREVSRGFGELGGAKNPESDESWKEEIFEEKEYIYIYISFLVQKKKGNRPSFRADNIFKNS